MPACFGETLCLVEKNRGTRRLKGAGLRAVLCRGVATPLPLGLAGRPGIVLQPCCSCLPCAAMRKEISAKKEGVMQDGASLCLSSPRVLFPRWKMAPAQLPDRRAERSRRALRVFLLPSHEIEALHKDTKGHYMKISSLGSFCLGQHFVAMRFSVILIVSGYQIMTTWQWQSALLF